MCEPRGNSLGSWPRRARCRPGLGSPSACSSLRGGVVGWGTPVSPEPTVLCTQPAPCMGLELRKPGLRSWAHAQFTDDRALWEDGWQRLAGAEYVPKCDLCSTSPPPVPSQCCTGGAAEPLGVQAFWCSAPSPLLCLLESPLSLRTIELPSWNVSRLMGRFPWLTPAAPEHCP